jgi:hypothetical protein
MSDTLIAVFVWALFMTIQSLMMSDFLRLLQTENPQKYLEMETERESFWNHLQPLRISLRYIVPGDYESWGLSAAAGKSAQRLRIVSIVAILSFFGAIAVGVIENV